MAMRAQSDPSLVHCFIERDAGRRGLAGNSDAIFVRPILLQINSDGNHHIVVETLA